MVYGPLLENIVFLDLKRRFSGELWYVREKYETDFYLPEQNHLIQVAFDLSNPETREREIRALTYFAEKYQAEKSTIVTRDQEEQVVAGDLTIDVVPVWKWLLRAR